MKCASGFGWDADLCIPVADEAVWADALAVSSADNLREEILTCLSLQKRPKSSHKWRTQPVPHYADMSLLAGNSTATGEGALNLVKAAAEVDDGGNSSSSEGSNTSEAAFELTREPSSAPTTMDDDSDLEEVCGLLPM